MANMALHSLAPTYLSGFIWYSFPFTLNGSAIAKYVLLPEGAQLSLRACLEMPLPLLAGQHHLSVLHNSEVPPLTGSLP